MPEANQYTFRHKELLEILIKQAGVHEGRWIIMMGFGFTAGNFGPDDEHLSPGAIVGVTAVGIQKAGPDSPDGMVLDAAVVNPRPTKENRKAG